jgi:hypothetical protein
MAKDDKKPSGAPEEPRLPDKIEPAQLENPTSLLLKMRKRTKEVLGIAAVSAAMSFGGAKAAEHYVWQVPTGYDPEVPSQLMDPIQSEDKKKVPEKTEKKEGAEKSGGFFKKLGRKILNKGKVAVEKTKKLIVDTTLDYLQRTKIVENVNEGVDKINEYYNKVLKTGNDIVFWGSFLVLLYAAVKVNKRILSAIQKKKMPDLPTLNKNVEKLAATQKELLLGFDMMRHYVAMLGKKGEVTEEDFAKLNRQLEPLLKKFNESTAEMSAGLLEGGEAAAGEKPTEPEDDMLLEVVEAPSRTSSKTKRKAS